MKIFTYLISLVLSFFNDNDGFVKNVAHPAIQFVNGVKSVYQKTKEETVSAIEEHVKQFTEDQTARMVSLFNDVLRDLGVFAFKKNPETVADSFELLADFLSKKPKTIQDAILFKIASQMVKSLSVDFGEDLTDSGADTLTQMAFAHAQKYAPEIVAKPEVIA